MLALDPFSAKFDEALQNALSILHDDILWQLGQYCESTQKLKEAILCYQAIPADNPHYKEANAQAAELVIQSELDIDKIVAATASLEEELEEKCSHNSREKERKNIEDQLNFLLKANDPADQDLVDQLYHQLGGGYDLRPSVKNIRPDKQTLFSLARQTCELREENQALQEKIKRLEVQLVTQAKSSLTAPQTLFGAPANSITSNPESASNSRLKL